MALPRRQLVILQQGPFCNIDCKYCYLPNRANNKTMSQETLEKVYHEVFNSNCLRDPITFLWHAGEPLAAGHAFFQNAFALAKEINKKYNRSYVHNIQTNATLIDEQWLKIFKDENVLMGVSLDGPAFIHDKNRVMRNGKGTHSKVMEGIKLLQKENINFEVIAVLTSFSLDYPDEIYNFFIDNKITGVGFNLDEIEGTHLTSSYQNENAENKYRQFMRRLMELLFSNPGKIKIREFHSVIPALISPQVKLGDGEGFNNTNRGVCR